MVDAVIVNCEKCESVNVTWQRQVSYVSRWRGGLPASTSTSLSSSATSTSAAYSSGYCSSCSELHDCKTPLRLLDLQRRQRTCSSDDVMRRKSLNNMLTAGSTVQQPSVKHELDLSMQVQLLTRNMLSVEIRIYTGKYSFVNVCAFT